MRYVEKKRWFDLKQEKQKEKHRGIELPVQIFLKNLDEDTDYCVQIYLTIICLANIIKSEEKTKQEEQP